MTIRLNQTNLYNNIETGSTSAANSIADLRFTGISNGNVLMTINSSGNIGIGTSAPTSKLNVINESSGTNQPTVKISRNLGSNNIDTSQHGFQLELSKLSDGKSMTLGVMDNGVGVIMCKEVNVGYQNLILNPISGNVGIGTSSPSSKLDVLGSIKTTGIINIVGGGPQINFGTVVQNDAYMTIGSFNNVNNILNKGRKLYIDNDVGIGTTAPATKLQVDGSILINSTQSDLVISSTNSTGRMRFLPLNNINYIQTGLSGTSDSKADLVFTSIGGVTTFMTLSTAGNVGIGTSSPSSGFAGTINNVKLALKNGGFEGGTSTILIGGDNNHYSSITAEHTGGGRTYLSFGTSSTAANPTERMRITNDGNVGIGTTSPSTKLDIFSSGIQLVSRASSISEIRGSKTSTTPETILRLGRGHDSGIRYASSAEFQLYNAYAGGVLGLASSGLKIRLGSNETDNPDSDIMTLWANGNVGIGTSSPSSKLDIAGNLRLTFASSNNDGFNHYDANGTTHIISLTRQTNDACVSGYSNLQFYVNSQTSPTSGTRAMYINTSGNVGIGTSSPGYRLDVNGSFQINHSNFGLSSFGDGANSILTLNNSHNGPPRHRFTIQNSVKWDVSYGDNIDFNYYTSFPTSANRLNIQGISGNVGIGTGSPRTSFEVLGSNVTAALNTVGEGGTSTLFFGTLFQNAPGMNAMKAAIIARGKNTFSRSMLHFCLDDTPNNDPAFNAGLNNTRMVIDSNGNVGIGTSSPTNTLEVVGSMKAPGGSIGSSWNYEVGGSSIAFTNVSSSYYVISGITYGVWKGTVSSAGGVGTVGLILPNNPLDGQHFIGYWMSSRFGESIYRVIKRGTSVAGLKRPGSINADVRLDQGDIGVGDVWTITFQYLI